MMECKFEIFSFLGRANFLKLKFIPATKEKMISRRMLKPYSRTARFSMKTTALLGNVEKI